MDIVSVGCVCTDVFVDKNEICPGGESLNFCGNACRLAEANCTLIGVIGNDKFGEEIIKKLYEYPINKDYLRVCDGVTANHKIHHTPEGDRYFLENAWTGGVYDSFKLTKFDLERIGRADVVHTTAYSPVIDQVVECRRKNSFVLGVDFNEYREFDKWEKWLDAIDVFFISGSEDVFDRLREWSEKYSCVFVATLAEKGSVAFKNGEEYRCKAQKVAEVVDTTGAGDSFEAGFMTEYYKSCDVLSAMKEGSRTAALNISRLGGF